MGWEQLPPEEPKWVTNFCQGCKDRQELIASLQAALAESEARVAGLLKELADYQKQLALEQQSVNELAAANYDVHQENKRLREALKSFMSCLHGDNGISFPTKSMFESGKKALGGAE